MSCLPILAPVSSRYEPDNAVLCYGGCRPFMKSTTSFIIVTSLAFIVAMSFTPVRGDTYPSKPVRIIVPYGPGGIADVTMRLVAQNLSKRFGQQFFIENRPGAGGVVGMQSAREAPA